MKKLQIKKVKMLPAIAYAFPKPLPAAFLEAMMASCELRLRYGKSTKLVCEVTGLTASDINYREPYITRAMDLPKGMTLLKLSRTMTNTEIEVILQEAFRKLRANKRQFNR